MLGLFPRAWPLLLALSVSVAFVVVGPRIASTQDNHALLSRGTEGKRVDSRRSILSSGGVSGDQQETYALVIDAGSSGSRIHVYKLRWQPGKPYPYVDLPDKCVYIIFHDLSIPPGFVISACVYDINKLVRHDDILTRVP
jgi:hypothetical protein